MSSQTPQPRPTVAICMIVKNEATLLPGCLDSVRDLADELVVVDTGSTDETVEIAKAHGARILHHPWQNDFSLHRNQSIAPATSDWILQIDADERLVTPAGTVRDILANADTKVAALEVLIQDKNRHGDVQGVFTFPRLFRRSEDVHYKGKVHNQLCVEGGKAVAAVTLDHFGYDLSPEKSREKSERTRELLREQLEERPDDPFVNLNLLYIEAGTGNTQEAARLAERICSAGLGEDILADSLYWPAYHLLFRAHVTLEENDAALRVLEQFRERVHPRHLDLLHLQAHASYLRKDWEGVLVNAQVYETERARYLSAPVIAARENVQSLNRHHEVMHWAFVAAAGQKLWKIAATFFRRLAKEPLFEESVALDMLQQAQYGEPELISEMLRSLWNRFETATFILSSLNRITLEQLPEADREHLQTAHLPNVVAEKSFEAGVLLMALKEYQEAGELLLGVRGDEEREERALFLAAQCFLEAGDRDRSIKVLADVTERFPLNHEAKVLADALEPETGEVHAISADEDDSKQRVLVEALSMCQTLWRQNKVESAIVLLGEVYSVFYPDSPLDFNEFEDILIYVDALEAQAMLHGYQDFKAALEPLKSLVLEEISEWVAQ